MNSGLVLGSRRPHRVARRGGNSALHGHDPTVVDSETLYAALSTYLLAGLFFGQIYWAIEVLAPGSLDGSRSD